MAASKTCYKCGERIDLGSGSRFCLACGADLERYFEEQEAAEEEKRKQEQEKRKAAEEERKRKEDEERKRKEYEARKRKEDEERKRKAAEAEAEASKRAEAQARRKAKAEAARAHVSKVLSWAVAAIFGAVIVYSFATGISPLEAPADMLDWVMWEYEGLTTDVPHKEGPVYRISKKVFYDSDGNLSYEDDFSYDRRGNVLTRKYRSTGGENLEPFNSTCEYSGYDDKGYYHVYDYGNESKEVSYIEESGRVVKKTWDSGYEEYEYYPGGTLKTIRHVAGDTTREAKYFDNGLIHSEYIKWSNSESGSDNESLETYAWEYDSKGYPKAYRSVYGTDEDLAKNSTDSGDKVVCDENGNIIKIYGFNGKLREEFEYEEILRPSLSAWVKGQVFDFLNNSVV